ncbi:MAG: hypothetical protein Ct9H90mP3_6370 [Flammeovirgaceae bacterium]|nr:MAG: hypothetical protein Ct9H90mP3_6370 [Flammeovirgaceae bacterium]
MTHFPRELRPESGLFKVKVCFKPICEHKTRKNLGKSLIDSSSLKKEIVENVDLVVVRELIGGIYFGKPRGHITNTKISQKLLIQWFTMPPK